MTLLERVATFLGGPAYLAFAALFYFHSHDPVSAGASALIALGFNLRAVHTYRPLWGPGARSRRLRRAHARSLARIARRRGARAASEQARYWRSLYRENEPAPGYLALLDHYIREEENT